MRPSGHSQEARLSAAIRRAGLHPHADVRTQVGTLPRCDSSVGRLCATGLDSISQRGGARRCRLGRPRGRRGDHRARGQRSSAATRTGRYRPRRSSRPGRRTSRSQMTADGFPLAADGTDRVAGLNLVTVLDGQRFHMSLPSGRDDRSGAVEVGAGGSLRPVRSRRALVLRIGVPRDLHGPTSDGLRHRLVLADSRAPRSARARGRR